MNNNFFDFEKLDKVALVKMTHVKGLKIGVACSGGGDSMFLLNVAMEFFGKKNLIVIHYDHSVRKNSSSDAKFVKDFCEKNKLKVYIGKRSSDIKKVSEENLRDLRMEFFEKIFAEENLSIILQGHNKNDIAEGFLMRLMRGSGSDGLCTPRPVSMVGGMTFVRPLLSVLKSEILKNLESKKISWCEDESNVENDFLRNKIRNIVLPIIEEVGIIDFYDSAYRSRKLLEEDSQSLDAMLVKETFVSQDDEMKLSEFATRNSALMRRAIHKILVSQNASVRSRAVDNFIYEAVSGNRVILDVAGSSLIFEKKENALKFFRKATEELFFELELGENKIPNGDIINVEIVELRKSELDRIKSGEVCDSECAYVDCKGMKLFVRNPKVGDSYIPIGAKSERKLKDIFCAKKISILKRKNFSLVCNKSGEIICGRGLSPSVNYAIGKNCSVVKLTYGKV